MKEIIKILFGGQGKIIPLSEGSFTIDKTKLFVPFDENKDDLQARSSGSLLVEIQPFVIVTPEDVLLLDTGLGFANDDGSLQIHQNLLNVGIDPRQITKILLTHLHKDHAGGVCLERIIPNSVSQMQLIFCNKGNCNLLLKKVSLPIFRKS